MMVALLLRTAEPLLKALTIKATKLILQQGDEGVVWKVTLWAAKLKKPTSNVDIGDVFIAADTGKVVRSDLKISKVD